MIKINFLIIGFFLITNSSFGQHLYSEIFDGCNTSKFCLDCGDSKAEPSANFGKEVISLLNKNQLKKINGTIEVQILIDTIGKPCLLSAKNESNVKSEKLGLQDAINNASNWSPAIIGNKPTQVSVSLILVFENGGFSIQRRVFDFKNNTNFKSTGTPVVKGTSKTKLTVGWTAYNQSNSDLPWDMSRAAVATNNAVWFGTDNGLVKMTNNKMEVFSVNNSPIRPVKYNKNKAASIMHAAVDKNDNLWFIAGSDLYKYDGSTWVIFDSTNSPINWPREIYIDESNNILVTSSKGVNKFNGTMWSTINTSNSKLPSNNISGVFIDSKNRLWIGTYSGNVLFDKEKTIVFEDSITPLKEGVISKMYEDKDNNLWFYLYNKEDKSKAGIFVLSSNGEWKSIKPKKSELFNTNDINDFLLDEQNNILWIALNSVGLIRYDISNVNWEIYTNQNSNVPSIHVMQLTKDTNGIIWAATFAGIIRMVNE